MVTESKSLTGRKVRFRVQQFIPGDDFDEKEPGSWSTVKAIQATLVPMKAGPEFVNAEQMRSIRHSTLDVRRLRHGCWSSAQRLLRLDNARIYNIDSVAALDERELWYRLTVVETDKFCQCPPTARICTC